MEAFRELLEELVTQYGGTKQDLAHAVGITPSSLSRLLTNGRHVAPTPEVCLRLASVTGASASKVLRAAGNGKVADLIEDLYGQAASRRQPFLNQRLKPHEQRHVAAVRALDGRAQRAFFLLVQIASVRGRASTKALAFRHHARS